MRLHCLAVLVASSPLLLPPVRGEDWPEWRGPRRDGISLEKDWMSSWTEGKPPRVAWRVQVGRGHSAVSVSRGRAVTMGWDGKQDTIHCLDAVTGKSLWTYSYPCDSIKQWPGPRSTPTISNDRVYTLSQHGLAHALDFVTGKLLWKVQLADSYNPDVDYGFAWSPLVEGELMILGGGERGLALRTRDGSYAWGNDGKAGACASPVRCDLGGKRVVVLVGNDRRESVYLVGIDPASGKQLWRSAPWPEKWGAACIDPIVRDGSVFLTTAEQQTAGGRFRVKNTAMLEEWSNRQMACYTGSCVLVKDCLFGVTKVGLLKCLDWKTGKEHWSQRGFGGHGALLAAGDHLIAQTSQSGEIIVLDATAGEYNEIRRFKVFTKDAETFTAPVVANGRLYCRSYAGEVACLLTGKTAE